MECMSLGAVLVLHTLLRRMVQDEAARQVLARPVPSEHQSVDCHGRKVLMPSLQVTAS